MNMDSLIRKIVEMVPEPERNKAEHLAESICEMHANDLAARKQTLERIHKSETQYRALFDNMTAGFALHEMIYDDQGQPVDYRFLQANPAFEKKTGLRIEAILGRTVREILPAIEPVWIETYGRVAQTGEPVEFESHSEALDRYYLVRAYSPAPNLFATVFNDITDRRQSEHHLQELSAIQAMILNNSPLGIALVRERRFEWVNPRMCEMAGMTEDQLRGASTRLFYTDDELFEGMGEKIYSALRKGFRFDDKILFNRQDGRQFWCRLIGTAIKPDHPNDGSLWMLEDITDQEAAETDRLRLSTAIEQSPEAIVITDPDGTIQYANPAFETITGYSTEETVGKNLRLLKSGEHPTSFYEEMWSTISSGDVWEGRLLNKHKNGSLYTEEASISPVKDANGCIINYVAIKRDITEELVKEEELRQAHKMEAIGQLAGGIAHDFNNILQAIIGFSEILRFSLDKDSQAYENAHEIHMSAKRAAALTQKLLTFSRKQPVQLEEVDLNNTIQDVEALLHVLLGRKSELVLDLQDGLPPVYADYGQLTQIIMNLSVNARDAMPAGGRLTISTESIVITELDATYISGARPGCFLCMAVTDTGRGMDAEMIARIFEPFFTTKSVGSGTGLGLSVIYGIVEQSNGWINVYSEPGKGSCFKVFLPAAETAGNENENSRQPESPPRNARILLVEDDPEMRKMVMHVLGNAGYEIHGMSSAEEGLASFNEQDGRFDLLMSDVELPGMRGDQFAEHLRTMKPELPVLLLSGYPDHAKRWKHFADEGFLFLNKPFTVPMLLDIVSEIFEKS